MKKYNSFQNFFIVAYHSLNITLFSTSFYIQYKNDMFEVGFIYIILGLFFLFIELIKLISYKTLFKNKPNKSTFFLVVIFSLLSVISNYKAIDAINIEYDVHICNILFFLISFEFLAFCTYFYKYFNKR